MSHPACCKNPDTCRLSYVEHLQGFVIGADAIPTRATHRTPGQPDEPAIETSRRNKRVAADVAAFKRLKQHGVKDAPFHGAAAHERRLGG